MADSKIVDVVFGKAPSRRHSATDVARATATHAARKIAVSITVRRFPAADGNARVGYIFFRRPVREAIPGHVQNGFCRTLMGDFWWTVVWSVEVWLARKTGSALDAYRICVAVVILRR